MRAYDESYVNDAMETLGGALDYAVYDCSQNPDEFFLWLIVSGVGYRFAMGDPTFVAGMSGVELAREVRFRITGERDDDEPRQPVDRSDAFWAGWILAYYQWLRNSRFAAMLQAGLTPSVLMERSILHEADLSKAVAVADGIMDRVVESRSPLAVARRRRGFTQQQLANASGVSLRMVQLYEQGRNDLSQAAASTVLHLAQALDCSMEDLL